MMKIDITTSPPKIYNKTVAEHLQAAKAVNNWSETSFTLTVAYAIPLCVVYSFSSLQRTTLALASLPLLVGGLFTWLWFGEHDKATLADAKKAMEALREEIVSFELSIREGGTWDDYSLNDRWRLANYIRCDFQTPAVDYLFKGTSFDPKGGTDILLFGNRYRYDGSSPAPSCQG